MVFPNGLLELAVQLAAIGTAVIADCKLTCLQHVQRLSIKSCNASVSESELLWLRMLPQLEHLALGHQDTMGLVLSNGASA